ncbi:AMP-binding protein, partial [Streptomyces sp. NPDC005070]
MFDTQPVAPVGQARYGVSDAALHAQPGGDSFGAVMNVVEFVDQLRFGDHLARYLGGTTGSFDELSIGVYSDGSPDSDLHIRLDAPARLYDRAELRFIGEELIDHIRAVAADGEQRVGALDVLTGTGREQVLTRPNDTGAPLPALTVPHLFARQTASAPDAVALQTGDLTLTYRELDERSSRLADALRRHGVGPDTVVAVALERSADLAVALLAVVKAGGAYLTLDPALPAAQAKLVTGDAAAHALLTDAATAQALSAGLELPALVLADLTAATDTAPATTDGVPAADAAPAATPLPLPHPDNLVAVSPTSTTGATTAVGITHRAMERLVLDRAWQGAARGTVLWHTPATSEALALELWAPLLSGGRVVVAPPGELDADALAQARTAHGITAVWLPAG